MQECDLLISQLELTGLRRLRLTGRKFDILLHRNLGMLRVLLLLKSRAGSFQAGEGVGNSEHHPTQRSTPIRAAPSRILNPSNYIAGVFVDLLVTDYTTTGLQESLFLFLHGQSFVVWHLEVRLLIGGMNTSRIIRQNSARSQWFFIIRIETLETRRRYGGFTSFGRIVCIANELELIRNPLTGERIHVVVLIHLTILCPNGRLRFSRTSSTENVEPIRTNSHNLTLKCFEVSAWKNLKCVCQSNRLLLQKRSGPHTQNWPDTAILLAVTTRMLMHNAVPSAIVSILTFTH